MGYDSNPVNAPGGPDRDDADHAKLRHGRLEHEGTSVGRYLMPAPLFFSRDGHNVFLGDMFRGGHAFLVCSGPSLNSHDLTLLQQRGIVTCALNNAATVVRSNLWVSVDDPGNFSDAIWRDPAITKFVPLCHMEKPFSVRTTTGELVPSSELVGDMPGVFGFRRNEAFNAAQFLYEDTVNWGNNGQRVDAHGVKGSRSVMLAALRVLFYLGVRTLYLLGCDFKMQNGAANYAFEQDRSRSSINGNNKTFDALNTRFRELLPSFEREGFRVFNCTPNSGLTAFPSLRYEDAIDAALRKFPRQVITAGMYDRKQREADGLKQITNSSESEGFHPSSITLFSTVDAENRDLLLENWKGWMKFNPWLKAAPAFVLCADKIDVSKLRKLLRVNHRSVECLPWNLDNTRKDRDRWTETWVRFPAERIDTTWYLKLDPDAVATAKTPWLNPDWFTSSADNRETSFIAPRWSYSKPGNILNLLDDWADHVPSLSQFPRLNRAADSDGNRVTHDAISSWLFLGNTEWTREISKLVTKGFPCDSFDTFMAFCAARRQDRFIRYALKEYGWDHSFHRKKVASKLGDPQTGAKR
jgi:hypothetical protein